MLTDTSSKISTIDYFKNSFPFITNGYVMDTDDPEQMGRMKIWCPTLDGETYTISGLPWAEYASPFGGVTNNFPVGRNRVKSNGPVPYGFYCLPKLNSQVLVFLLNGSPNRRFYFAATYDLHRNRGLPSGRNKTDDLKQDGPFTDAFTPLEPAYTNLRAALGQDLSNPIAQTRGGYERQVAQPRSNKDGTEGYAPAAADPTKYLDPQTYCWVTPGHHTITMNDTSDNCRIRIKTCEGNQIILDDTNERIYISTASGNTWIELDEDGHIHMYGAKSISVRAEEDVNLAAGRNINLDAKGSVNIKSEASTRVTGGNVHIKAGATLAATGCTLDLVGTKARMTGDTVDIKSLGLFALQGSKITAAVETTQSDADKDERILPGGPAAQAECAEEAYGASIIPSHEPFARPVNRNRNSHYKG